MKDSSFTPTQVGTLLEAMDKKIDILTEVVLPMPNKLEEIKESITNLEFNICLIKDMIRIEIPSIKSRLSILEAKT